MNSLFTLEQILTATRGMLLVSGPSNFSGISTDTRTLQAGDLYLALHGEKMNGHQFLTQAREKGAAGAIIDETVPGIRPRHTTPGEWSVIDVTDTLYALGQLAAYHRRRFPRLPIIGITGSAGKTTTKEMTAAILEKSFPFLRNPGNYNNEIGMPLSLMQLRREHQAAVLEFGMRGRGQISYLASIARPTIGIITNIGLTHLELLGTKEEIALSKAELFDEMPTDSINIIPLQDEYFPLLREHAPGQLLTFAEDGTADFFASDIRLSDNGALAFNMHTPNSIIPLMLQIAGRHQLLNALAAAAAAMSAGADEAAIQSGLAEYQPTAGRMHTIKTRQGYTVIDDSYNANPAAVRATLDLLAEYPGERKIAILGDMRELGSAALEMHTAIGQHAIALGIDSLMVVGELALQYVAGANDSRAQWFPDNQSLLKALLPNLRPGDVILIKGSRAMHLEEIVEALTSETQVA